MPLTAEDRRTIRMALSQWAGYARERANIIAQDRDGKLRNARGEPIPTSAVGDALDEAKRAERLIGEFATLQDLRDECMSRES